MFGLLKRKEAKEEFDKISKAFKDMKKDMISKKEIELMIKEAILDVKETSLYEPIIREPTPRTSRTKLRKKADKILDKAEICSEMANLLKEGYSSKEVFDIIVNQKQLIKHTCFYKYMKIVREQVREVHEPTP